MRSVLFPLFAAFAFVALSGCPPTKPPCATTCTGCCDSMGQCQLGSQGSACGKGGIACKTCQVAETCDFGTCTAPFSGSGGGFSGTGGGNSGGAGGGTAGGFVTGGGSTGGGFVTGGGAAGGFVTGGGSTAGGAANGGETCALAVPMRQSTANEFVSSGTLAGALDDHAGSCGGAGRDVAFSFPVGTTSDVSFGISSIGGTGSPVGYLLRDDCSSEVACSTGTSTSTPVRLGPGSYRLIVDALSTSSTGSFSATVLVNPVAPLAGDDCASAESISVGGSATASTDGYSPDHTSFTCNTNGPDRFYRFTLATSTAVTATVTPTSSSSYFGAYFIGPGSCTASEEFCRVSMSGGAATTATTTLAAGTHYLAVKNLSSGPGSYVLTLSSSATVPGDSCSTAVPLSFSGGVASASGTVVGASNDRTSSCASSSADVVYAVAVPSSGTLSVGATVTSGSWRPILTLTSGTSCTSATETTCNAATTAGGPATLSNVPVTAGTYYLWVDSVSGAGAGTFSLALNLTSGGTGDSCAAPIPLTFTGGTASVTGSTTGLGNDNTSTCATTSGPDLVYSFPATSGQVFSATLSPSGFAGQLVLRGPNSVCTSAAQVTCQIGSTSGATVAITGQALSTGTYYLWVDGATGGSGAYSLTANLGSTTATGENCSTAIPLNFIGTTATASGTTSTAVSDRSGSCAGSGPDRVYSFTVSGTRTFSVTVTPGSSYQPVIYLTSASNCGTGLTDLGCVYNSTIGSTTTMATQTLSTGTYYLWLDTFGSNPGTYSFTATLQ